MIMKENALCQHIQSKVKFLDGVRNIYIYIFDNRGTFHGQALRTLHGDPNLGVLTAPRWCEGYPK